MRLIVLIALILPSYAATATKPAPRPAPRTPLPIKPIQPGAYINVWGNERWLLILKDDHTYVSSLIWNRPDRPPPQEIGYWWYQAYEDTLYMWCNWEPANHNRTSYPYRMIIKMDSTNRGSLYDGVRVQLYKVNSN